MLVLQDPEIFSYKTLEISWSRPGLTAASFIQQVTLINGPLRKTRLPSCFVCMDSAFSWRYQIVDLVERGYRVIAPDLLGFGGTSKPTGLEAYAKASMCKSIVEILDHEGVVGKITIVSHDWGSILAARFLSYHPDKVKFWATLCVPPTAPAQLGQGVDYVEWIRKHIPKFGYQIYFMSEESNEEMDRYCQTVMLLLYFHFERGLETSIEERLLKYKDESIVFEDVLQKQLKEVGDELESVTIEDPARTLDERDEEAALLPVAFSSDIRCLFMGAPNDPPLPPGMFTEDSKRKMFPSGNVECINIEGGNHFFMEAPSHRSQVTKVLGDWIDTQEKLLAATASTPSLEN
ncbi:uncharacterized protein PGTG_05973 [Puccinia graminis f. sp. tritici CRL 75-36-700-3]|uniref:AB hydrolase-1 domain-containing protein n=1 Tax=Puccinia graminis f. sp. tritici (strain CRL 75-36-700-3 / race SCCL) TaxID=418459 RepID=E3K681_PUCGT|nr:uncharacterized protein PGTG_05973 [Puccinia graminis f. sp. tritici CRL 75-36-700-3]EFP79652.1 hypothetical protein PGTG_05973 [Puccinia graminis f. sp. tritici CRL 75-36-700-3]